MERREPSRRNCALRRIWCSLRNSDRQRREGRVRYLPDLESLQSFLAVAEERNFRKAAERMGIDHSAMSRRIKELELRLGFNLLFRTTREVHLTDAGRAFYDENRVLLAGLRGSIETARRIAAGSSGHVRIGYMAFAALTAMPASVAAFRRTCPDVSVELVYMGTQTQKIALAQGRLDAGFLIGPFEYGDFATLRLSDEALLAVLPQDHPLAAEAAVRLADLARLPLVLGDMEVWNFYRLLLDELFARNGLALAPAFEASSTLGILGLVAAGLGASLLPEGMRRLGAPGLSWRPLADCALRIEITLVWPNTASRAVTQFVAACGDALR